MPARPPGSAYPLLPPRSCRGAGAAGFVGATILCLLLAEFLFRLHGGPPSFWDPVDASPPPPPSTIVFIGTSRVGAAINAAAFRQLFPPPQLPPRVVNIGTGYTVASEYYLALRNTLQSHPDVLKHATFFVEAPGGMAFSERWKDPWPNADAPDILNPLMHARDIGRYWAGPHSIENKAGIFVGWLLDPSLLYTQRHFFGAMLDHKAHAWVEHALDWLFSTATMAHPAKADLAAVGGIRTDADGIALARRLSLVWVQNAKLSEHPVDWNHTIIADFVKLAQAHGIQVLFFSPPLPAQQQVVFETPVEQANRASFRVCALAWHTPILEPDFPVSDSDFPDGWHLRYSLSTAYTRALYSAWRNALAAPAPLAPAAP